MGAGSVWLLASNAADPTCGSLTRIDLRTAEPSGCIPILDDPLALAYGAGGLWVLGQPRGQRTYTLSFVDPTTDRVARHFALSAGGSGDFTTDHGVAMAVSPTAVWLSVAAGGPRVLRVNPQTGGLDATVGLDAQATSMATNARGVFVGLRDGTVARLDPAANRITGRVRVSEGTGAGVVEGQSVLWVTTSRDRGRQTPTTELVKLDPTSLRVTRTGVPVFVVVAADGLVWVADYGLGEPNWLPGLVGQVDPRTNRLVRATYLPTLSSNGPTNLAIAGSAVWSLNGFTSTLTRLGL